MCLPPGLVGSDLPPALYYFSLFSVNIKQLRHWNTSGWKRTCQRLTRRNWTNVVISLLLQLWKQNLCLCPAVCRPFCGQHRNVAAVSLTSWSAASKNYPFDGNTFGRFPSRIHDGALPGWGAEPGVGVSTRFSCTEHNQKGHDGRINLNLLINFKESQEKANGVGQVPFSGVQSLFFHEVTVTPVGRGSSMPSQ